MRTTNLWKTLLLSAAMLATGVMTSCEEKAETEFDAELSTSIESATVTAGEEVTFTVTSNTTWTATIDDANNILNLSKTSGKSGTTSVTAKISESAPNRSTATVTFTAIGKFFGYEMPVTRIVTFSVKANVTPSDEPMIDNIDNLVAGTYYMSGYGIYNGNDAETFNATPYHLWDGLTYETSGKTHLETTTYSYEDGVLTKAGNYGDPANVDLVEADGNAFYIMLGNQYLSVPTGSGSGLLSLGSTPYKWTPLQLSDQNGYSGAVGIVFEGESSSGAYLGTAKASSSMIREYYALTSSYGNNFQNGLVFFNPDKVSFGESQTPQIPTDYTKATIAEFNAAPVSTTVVYELTGTVSNIASTVYGNFDLTDDTASVYVYGLSSNPQAVGDKTDQTFGSMGITAGAKIKIRGYRGDYQGKIEVLNAWLIEIIEKGSGSTDPDPTPGDDANVITKTADVKAGTYYLAGYSESYNTTTYAPYSYHLWTGTVSSNSGNSDLNTVNYQYNKDAKGLTLNPNLSAQDAAKGTAVKVEIVSAGSANTYYIKYNGKYLYSSQASTNRRMALGDSPAEWVFSDHDKGGICITSNDVILGTAGATYDLLRSYKTPASSLVYGICLFTESVSIDGTSGGGGNTGGGNEGGGNEGGGNADGTFVITNANIKDLVSLPTNSYGSQSVTDNSTWVSWTYSNFGFTGCRICIANAANYADCIQMQGNASTTTNQGFIYNTTSFGKITKMVITTVNTSTYPTPSFNLYYGTSAGPSDKSKAYAGTDATTTNGGAYAASGIRYISTYNFSGDYGFFAIRNDTQGATYIEKIEITYEK